jgi:hypothetical protein
LTSTATSSASTPPPRQTTTTAHRHCVYGGSFDMSAALRHTGMRATLPPAIRTTLGGGRAACPRFRSAIPFILPNNAHLRALPRSTSPSDAEAGPSAQLPPHGVRVESETGTRSSAARLPPSCRRIHPRRSQIRGNKPTLAPANRAYSLNHKHVEPQRTTQFRHHTGGLRCKRPAQHQLRQSA